MSNDRSVHGIARGRVQGVFYRASLQKEATALSLTGWVRNLADGAVEFLAQGESESVQALLNWAERGPTLARVSAVEIEDIQPAHDLQGFEIRY